MVMRIHFASDVSSEQVEVTQEHPFWVVDKGWVLASDLQIGDEMRTRNGVAARIQEIDRLCAKAFVYNITVDSCHTYFVGTMGILVHNKPP